MLIRNNQHFGIWEFVDLDNSTLLKGDNLPFYI